MHINIYGPAASGKTRFSEEFRKHYGCKTVIDEGKEPAGYMQIRGRGPHLILTIAPVKAEGVRNVPIRTALFCIGKVL